MEKKYKILQIGPEDWQDTLALPAQLDWHHVPPNTPSAIQKIMDEKDLEQFHVNLYNSNLYFSEGCYTCPKIWKFLKNEDPRQPALCCIRDHLYSL